VPTNAVPWTYAVERDVSAGTTLPRHTHPSIGIWNDAGHTYFDSNIAVYANWYFTNYLNAAAYAVGGSFNTANIRFGAFVCAISGGSTGIQNAYGFNVARAYVTSTIEFIIAAQQTTWTALKATADASGTCNVGSSQAVTLARSAACTRNACNVTVPMSGNGWNTTVSVVAISGAESSEPAVAPNAVVGAPVLPVAGAQLFLDANSMSSWKGATGAGALNCVGPGSGSSPGSGVAGTCRPMVWWPSVEGNNYLFAQSTNAGQRPYQKAWSPEAPYQSMVFDGTDDNVQLDLTIQAKRDAEFNMQFPDQPAFDVSRDAQSTWFMLYQPSDLTATTSARTVFGKGQPTSVGGSSYQYYQQRPVFVSGTNYNQWQGFAVAGVNGPSSSGLATTVGNQYIANSVALTGNPHSLQPTLITLTHYRNNSFSATLSSRTYVLNACVGIQTGNFLTDACSDGLSSSPADPWSERDAMGLGIVRQAALNLIAGVPAGVANIADYGATSGTINPAPNAFLKPNAPFSVGTAGFTASSFRGQMLALVMYRKSLTLTERQDVQTYLLGRYNQLCPVIPTPAGATGGCAASVSGSSCTISCAAGRSTINGKSALTCKNGQWLGKAPTCANSCPSRSKPKDAATCSQLYASYDFTSATAFPVNAPLSSLAVLETITPAFAPYSLTDLAWRITQPVGYSVGMLVGSPYSAPGCNPVTTGTRGLVLGENMPAYLTKLGASGFTMIVEASLRLMVPGTQAGISVRTSSTGGIRVLIGQAAVGVNAAIVLQKIVGDVVTNSVPLSVGSNWDQSGLASAPANRLRLSAVRNGFTDPTNPQTIYVDIISSTGSITRLATFADTVSSAATGVASLVVMSGSAAFQSFTVSGDCDNNGASCSLYAGQSCSWTCAVGNRPVANLIPIVPETSVYPETCDAAGSMTGASGPFDCMPLPPVFPAATFSISEDATVNTIVGKLNATAINAKQVVLYSLTPGAALNSALMFDAYGAVLTTVFDVFSVNSCSGEVYLNRGGVMNWFYGKRSFSLTMKACTNGVASACTSQNITVVVLNTPTPPLYYADQDSVPAQFGQWVRTIPENCVIGTPLWRYDASSVSMVNITAVSNEGTPLAYDIPYGNAAGLFAIDPVFGRITVVKPRDPGCVGACVSALNFESTGEYAIIVRASDTVNVGKFATLQVLIKVIDRNDPLIANAAAGGTTQYLTITEESAQLPNADCGALAIDDEDSLQPMTRSWGIEAFNASFVGLAPQLVVNSTGQTVRLQMKNGITYPLIGTSPIIAWRNLNVRAVISAVVRVQDRGGATITINVQIGVVSTFNPGNEPVAVSVILPMRTTTGPYWLQYPSLYPGFNTAGGQRFTITGQNFLTINSTYGGIVSAIFRSQVGDIWPNRTYVATGCAMVNDATISCVTPAGWGDNLAASLTYGPAARNMAMQAPLPVKYLGPRVAYLQGSGAYLTETTLADRAALSTDGGQLLIAHGWDFGLQADAARTITVEYGMPVPGTEVMDSDGVWSVSLEYVAPYVPCRSTVNATYERWPTAASPGGFFGDGSTRICFLTAPGIGTQHVFQIRVGSRVSPFSNVTTAQPGWNVWLGYRAPSLSRMWVAPINRLSDVPGNWFGPPTWDPAAACCSVSALGGDLVYVNGTNFGPMNKMPMVHFYVGGRMLFIDGLATLKNVNYSVGLTPAGVPDCFKPDPTRASSLMACRTPPGTGQGMRMRLQLGNQAFVGNLYQHSYVYPKPVLTAVAGPGVVNGGTEGRQLLVLTGSNFGPLPNNYQKSITNN